VEKKQEAFTFNANNLSVVDRVEIRHGARIRAVSGSVTEGPLGGASSGLELFECLQLRVHCGNEEMMRMCGSRK